MKRWLTGWRISLLIASREARRARGRALLVVAMLAIPIAALAFAAVNFKTFELTADEKADRQMGQAEAVVTWPQHGPVQQLPDTLDALFAMAGSARPGAVTEQELLAALPAGTHLLSDRSGQLTVHTATGVATLSARLLAYDDPLAQGILRQLEGRAPAAADEVSLTTAAARRIGVGVGGSVRLVDRNRTFHVVGIVESPDKLRATTLVFRPGTANADLLGPGDPRDAHWLAGTPGSVSWAQVKQLNKQGIVVLSRQVLAHPPPDDQQYQVFSRGDDNGNALAATSLVAGIALLEVVLLAGPAFAVGAKRRRRDLALVAAAGGTPAHLRRIVLADGVVLGAAAAVLGLALGVGVAIAGMGFVEEHLSHSRGGSLRVFPVALVCLAGLAVVTGLIASVVPAWIAARQDVVTALAGRRGVTRSRRRWVVLGGVVMAAGAVLVGLGAKHISATTIVAGLVVLELGLVVCTPALVGLAGRAGRWLPLAPRIALRDTSRNRTAAAPAISAVMAAVVGSLAMSVIVSAQNNREQADRNTLSRPGDVTLISTGGGKGPFGEVPATVVTSLRSTFPVDQVHRVDEATCADECFITAVPPTAKVCPFARRRGRELTRAEQKAARRDSRCDGVRKRFSVFGGIGSDSGMTLVIDDSAVAAVTRADHDDAEAVRAALRTGAVVVGDKRYLDNGMVTLEVTTFTPNGPGDVRTVRAHAFLLPHSAIPLSLMTSATAHQLGLSTRPLATLATTTRMPTVAEQDRLQAAVGSSVMIDVDRGTGSGNAHLLVLAIVAGVITLGAAAIATGLAAADGRADLATLAAVGASPRVRRALSLSQSGVIAGLGSVLGVAAGLGASSAVLEALNRRFADVWPEPTPYPIDVPWTNVWVALLVVPAIAMAGAGLLTRSRLPIERRE